MGKTVTSNIIITFLSWYYITIQKIIRNGQAVLEIVFRRMIEDHEFFHFRQKKVHINGLDFCQNSKNLILGHFGPFLPKFGQMGFFRKNRAVTFDPL